MGAGGIPPVRVTLSLCGATVGERAADTVALGEGRFAYAGRAGGRITVFAVEATRVGRTEGGGMIRVGTIFFRRGGIDQGGEGGSNSFLAGQEDRSLDDEVGREERGDGRDAKAKVDPA